MSRTLQIAMWLGVLLSFTVITHSYLWWHIVRSVMFPKPWRNAVTLSLIFLSILYISPFFARHSLASPWREILVGAAFTWMGLSLILLTAFVGVDLVRIFSWLWGKFATQTDASWNPERRLFFLRLLTGGAGLTALGAGGYALASAAKGAQLKKVQVRLRRLSKEMSGTKIVQISDLHVGAEIGQDYVRDVVQQTNAANPDLVAITGDLVDGGVDEHADTIALLGEIKAKYGVFFVTGNHEYYAGVEPWLEKLRTLGVRILRNERVLIGDERTGFDLAGVDDSSAHRYGHGHGADVGKALKGRDSTREVVLLAHQPKEIFAAAANQVGLQLSGHTHGGQIWPFRFLVRLTQPYIAGLDKHEGTFIYVNRGTGYWGPPMRLGGRSELTLIELISA